MTIDRTIHAKLSRQTVRGGFVTSTVAFALSHGLSMSEIEKVTGIRGVDLANPEKRLPDDALPALWQCLNEAHPDEVLSLKMAQALPFSVLGGLADGAQFAKSLREALSLFIENDVFIADRLVISLKEVEGEAAFIMEHPLDKRDNGRTTEHGLGMAYRFIHEMLGIKTSLKRVELAHAHYGPAGYHESYFGAPVHFDSSRYALILHQEALDHAVSQQSSELFVFVRRYLDQMRKAAQVRRLPEPLNDIRTAIITNASRGLFSPHAAAAAAGISYRKAQRLTAAHGETLQSLIRETRVEMASEMLKDPQMSIESIASILGYSDDRAFRRAFKSWIGVSPTTYRIENQ